MKNKESLDYINSLFMKIKKMNIELSEDEIKKIENNFDQIESILSDSIYNEGLRIKNEVKK